MSAPTDITGILWPLKLGDTLTNHDWWPFYGHRFLGSPFVRLACREGRHADIGAAIMLRTAAVYEDPAGTLPLDDTLLSDMARFPTVEAWQAVRSRVLDGWVPVDVDTGWGDTVSRLGHPEMLGIVAEMADRAKARAAGRTAGADRKKAERIRKKLRGLGLPKHICEAEDIVARLVRHFNLSGVFVTDENIRAALADVIGYTGDVVPLGRGSSIGKSIP